MLNGSKGRNRNWIKKRENEGSNSMWKKSRLVLLSSALAFAVTCNATNYVAFAADNEPEITEPQVTEPEAPKPEYVNQNYVKIIFEDKVLFHEQLPTKTMIQVLNASDEVLESEVLSGDMELELDKPKISKGKMLSYWSIERKNDKLLIRPVLVQEKELSVKFLSQDGGQLLQHNAQTKEIVKSVNKGSNLKDILPEVNPKEKYKFAGWFEILTTDDNKKIEEKVDVDEVKITDSNRAYYAKFYPDFNDNNIDDRTEEITVKFVTNSEDKFNDIKTHVGKQIKLPILKKKDSVFMGWYTDEEYKNKFNNDDILTESQTLYAKWETADKVIQEAQSKPITDKDISDQIERILNERLQDYKNNNAAQTPNSNINAAQQPNTNTTSSNPPNASNTNDTGLTVVEPPKPSYEGNTGTTFTEKKYVFANGNIGEVFMVKFFDKNGSFLFSLTLPYGKTVKLYDENEKLHGEYAIRQDTTITLDTNDFVNKGSILLGFDSREIRVNSTQITEVFPKVKVDSASETLAHQQMLAAEEAKQAAKKKNLLMFLFLSLGVGGIGGGYWFIRKRRLAREQLEGAEVETT